MDERALKELEVVGDCSDVDGTRLLGCGMSWNDAAYACLESDDVRTRSIGMVAHLRSGKMGRAIHWQLAMDTEYWALWWWIGVYHGRVGSGCKPAAVFLRRGLELFGIDRAIGWMWGMLGRGVGVRRGIVLMGKIWLLRDIYARAIALCDDAKLRARMYVWRMMDLHACYDGGRSGDDIAGLMRVIELDPECADAYVVIQRNRWWHHFRMPVESVCMRVMDAYDAGHPSVTDEDCEDARRLYDDRIKPSGWTRVVGRYGAWRTHAHGRMTTKLFGTLLMGLARMERAGVVECAHKSMLEEMLECWTWGDARVC